MFFIGIFGIDKKNEELRALYDTECGECSGKSCTLYKEYYRFHFFFIPLITWGRKYRIVCESCGSVYSVQEEKKSYTSRDMGCPLYRGRRGRTSSFTENSSFSTFSGNENSFGSNSCRCPECGAEIKNEWIYCPECGRKL